MAGVALAIGLWKAVTAAAEVVQTVWNAGVALGVAVQEGYKVAMGISTAMTLAQTEAVEGSRLGLVAFTVAQYAVRAATAVATAAQWLWNAAMDANPIGIVVVAIAALVGGAILAYQHFGWFRDAVNAVGQAFVWLWHNALEPVVDFFKNHWQVILAVVAPFIGIPILIVQNWGKIVAFFEQIATGVLHALEWVATLPIKLYEWVVSNGGLLGLGKRFMKDLVDGLTAGAVAVWAWLSAVPGEILDLLSTAGQWLLQTGQDLLSGLWHGIVAGAVAVWSWLTALPGQIWRLVAAAGSWLLTTGVNLLTGLWNGLVNGETLVFQWFIALPGRLVGFLSALGSDMLSIGRNVVEGIWNGISNAAGWLEGQIAGFAKGLVGGVMKFLGISSPSRVFAEQVGQWIPKGIAAGIDAHAGAVHTSMRNMLGAAAGMGADFTVPGAGGAGLAGVGSGGTPVVNITINNAGNAIAVRDLLDEIQTGMVQLGFRRGLAKTYQAGRR